MSWVTVGVAAAGLIAGKMKNDRAQEIESSDRKLAAETQRYSPWTGMQGGKISRAGSQFGDMFSGAVGGAMMGQSLSKGMQGAPDSGTPMAGGSMGDAEKMQFISPEDKMQFQMDQSPYARRTV